MPRISRHFALICPLVLLAVACDQDSRHGARPGPGPGPGPGPEDGGDLPECCGIDAVEDLTPDQGWTIHIPPFEVPAGTEVTDCYFLAVPDLANGGDIWIDKIKVGQRLRIP